MPSSLSHTEPANGATHLNRDDVRTSPAPINTEFTFTPNPDNASSWPQWPATTTKATSHKPFEHCDGVHASHMPSASSSDIPAHDVINTEFTFTPDPANASKWPQWPAATTTRATSHQPSGYHGDVHASDTTSAPSSGMIHARDVINTESTFTPGPDNASKRPQTATTPRATSHQPSEWSETQTTMIGVLYDGRGAFDNASSSVTLQDEFPWHEVDIDKYPHRMPSTIYPALLLQTSDSPSSTGRASRKTVIDSDASDADDSLPRYSVSQKGKWKVDFDEDVVQEGDDHQDRSPLSPDFFFDTGEITVEEWVAHNKPLLQEYADRQTSLPLGSRLEVSIDEPSKIILGAIHLLVNRDPKGCTDPRRQLGPQLIENFVDIDRWTKEYFRSRHGAPAVSNDITSLLTIIMNSFFEGQVQLIDQLVESAFKNMHISGRSDLALQDFAFGFDFRMSHDLPFYVETSSRLRKPLPIPAIQVPSASEPVTTASGRQVKPTERAQAAAEDTQRSTGTKRGKRKSTRGSARERKSTAQPSSDRVLMEIWKPQLGVVTPGTSDPTRYRPAQPSNLREPPILPDSLSTPGKTPPWVGDGSKSKPWTSASSTSIPSLDVSGACGSSGTVQTPRMTIKIPARLPLPSTAAAIGASGSTSSDRNGPMCPIPKALETTIVRGTSDVSHSGSGSRPRGALDGRGSGSPTLGVETLYAATTPDNGAALSTAPSTTAVGTGDIVACVAAVDPSVSPTADDALGSGAGKSTKFGVRSHGGGERMGTQDDDGRGSTSQGICSTEKKPVLPPSGDPGHPRRHKKRKLNECDGG